MTPPTPPLDPWPYVVCVRLPSTPPQESLGAVALPLQVIYTTSKRLAQQAAIALAENYRAAAGGGREDTHEMEVLCVAGPLPLRQSPDHFLAALEDEWESVKREATSPLWWINGHRWDTPQEKLWGDRPVVVTASTHQEALYMAAFYTASRCSPPLSPPEEIFHLFSAPARAVKQSPQRGMKLHEWLIPPSKGSLADYTESRGGAPYIRLSGLALRTPDITKLLPEYLPDVIARLHYRQAALRADVINMCSVRGNGMVILNPVPNAENIVDIARLQKIRDSPHRTVGEYFIDAEDGWYNFREWIYAPWGVTKEDVHNTYHHLRPVDLLRFTCSELSEEVIQEWNQRFPWDKTRVEFAPHPPLSTTPFPMTQAHDLHPWYTLHTKLWRKYMTDCRLWSRGQAYEAGTVLAADELEEHPWLKKEFSVKVGAALERHAHRRVTVERILREREPLFRCDAVISKNLRTTPATWKEALVAAGVQPGKSIHLSSHPTLIER